MCVCVCVLCVSLTIFDGTCAQVFVVKNMTIQLIFSWMLSLPVRGREVVKATVDFKVHICAR